MIWGLGGEGIILLRSILDRTLMVVKNKKTTQTLLNKQQRNKLDFKIKASAQ